MSEIVRVGMADLNVGRAPNSIITVGLGSCVGLTMYDPVYKIGGMVHYMLPDSKAMKNVANINIAKFADTGIVELLKRVTLAGADRRRLVAKIAGGAKMFQMSNTSTIGNIGERNVVAAKTILNQLGIVLVAEDTGLDYGRTVELNFENGDFSIKSIKHDTKII